MYSRRIRFKKEQNRQEWVTDNDRLRAVALAYEPGEDIAPRVVASGQGKMAEQIIAIAKKNGIPIRDDPFLAAALSSVDVEQVIPPELYVLVAEVLAYVYRVRHKSVPPQPSH